MSEKENHTKQKFNDLIDEMGRKLNQLDAMLNVQSDRESFERWSDTIREHYIWACNDMVEQALVVLDKMSKHKEKAA